MKKSLELKSSKEKRGNGKDTIIRLIVVSIKRQYK